MAVAAVSFVAAGLVLFTVGLASAVGPVPAATPFAQKDLPWVRYALTGTRITMRWQLLRAEGTELVIRVDTYIAGELRSTKELKRPPLRVPADHRRETIVAAGRHYDCKVFVSGTTTYWYSEEAPLLGIVRTRVGPQETMEMVETPERSVK